VIGPQSFLAHARFRYLKLSCVGVLIAVAAYIADEPLGGPNGGTWLGYGLGATCAVLVLWLLWYGVRKRSYRATTPLRGWLSGHVYLGTALLILVPLHAGFQFDWNIHTLAYGLLCATSLSGLVAVIFYTWVPTRITANIPGQKLDGLLEEIADIDAECRIEVVPLPDAFAQAIALSIGGTRIGGGILRQFSRKTPNCGTGRAIETLRDHTIDLDAGGREGVRRLMELLSIKQSLLARVRRDMRYKAMLEIWMLVHVPLSLAAAAAVFVHIFSVFYYW
jgi:hypothetical protein